MLTLLGFSGVYTEFKKKLVFNRSTNQPFNICLTNNCIIINFSFLIELCFNPFLPYNKFVP